MNKIILLFWVLSSDGSVTEPQEFDGWFSMAECEVAAESLTESNAKAKATYKYAVIAQCITVPK